VFQQSCFKPFGMHAYSVTADGQKFLGHQRRVTSTRSRLYGQVDVSSALVVRRPETIFLRGTPQGLGQSK
jgi:hypothetical protein